MHVVQNEKIIAKECKRCLAIKPLSDFYIRKGSNLPYSYCKICQTEVCSTGIKRKEPANKYEKIAVAQLERMGYPVQMGKNSHDLTVFGCIRVEVKLAIENFSVSPNSGDWRICFTPNQIVREIDVILVVNRDGIIATIDGMNPKLFKEDGVRFQGKTFRVFAPNDWRSENSLRPEDLRELGQLLWEKLHGRMHDIACGKFTAIAL